MAPASFESRSCVVAGQDARAKPMLERMAADIGEAAKASAMEERSLQDTGSFGPKRMCFSVIWTTADLKVLSRPVTRAVRRGESRNLHGRTLIMLL